MSVMSDRWIRRQCSPVVALGIKEKDGRVYRSVPLVGDDVVSLVERESGNAAFLLCKDSASMNYMRGFDRILHRDPEIVDQYPPMIEPFEPSQVKVKTDPFPSSTGEDDSPRKVISYGTSSYGYDLRCSNKFKIFTNVNSTIVDPKNFDPKSFVDFEDDCCIIPPNSFALASSVEYFRIPRNILTICLGKSTYARCFTGDTRVALVDGASASFIELVARSAKGERFWGYAVNEEGKIEVAELTVPRMIGHEKVIEVVLDNEQVIRCTPDHKFMLRSGQYVEAKDLKPEDSLMPLYRGEYRGYESVYQPVDGRMISTHWMSDLWNVQHGMYKHSEGTHRHHVDRVRRNNRPNNITRLTEDEHQQLHNAERWTDVARVEHGERIVAALDQLREDAFWFASFQESQREKALSFWSEPQHAEAREKVLNNLRNLSPEAEELRRNSLREYYLSESVRAEHAVKMRKAWEGNEVRRTTQREIARKINLREEITEAVLKGALEVAKTIRGASRILKCDRSVFRRFPAVMSWFYGFKMATNHKVVAVREVSGTHDVYCLSVPEFGNFALESGVFVKNCGIVVNVTPLEPEWEGHVTLEFSNTTPLPAKIYANEGVAQVIFLNSFEGCETSYKDREGKYMNQEATPVAPKV